MTICQIAKPQVTGGCQQYRIHV